MPTTILTGPWGAGRAKPLVFLGTATRTDQMVLCGRVNLAVRSVAGKLAQELEHILI